MFSKKQLFSVFLVSIFLTGCSINSANSYTLHKVSSVAPGPIPILVYHSVTNNIFSKNKDLFTKPEEFEKQLRWINNSGYTTIFPDQLKTIQNIHKPILITFDDGYSDNYTTVFPLVKKYRVKICIFVATRFINKDHYLTSDQIKEMARSGLVCIESHTVSHHHLSQLPESELKYELENSKDAIFKLTGKYPIAIAYPYGDFNNSIITQTQKYYTLGFTTDKGNLSNSSQKLTITRYGIGRFTTLKDLKKYINSIK